MATTQKNEGEGSRSAARVYNKATATFAKSGKVGPAAKEAKRAMSSEDERRELKKAETAGRRKATSRAATSARDTVKPRSKSR
jgi:hypothetical protein